MQYIIYESAVESQITEFKSNGSIVKFTTVLQEADVKNRNGRIYPKPAIVNGLQSPIVQEKLRTHTLFGECGHPFSTEIARQTNVDMRNAAFRIDEFYWEGNKLYGRCQTLDTALGRDMAGLIKQGCQLSFSMRGQGNVTKDPYRDALVVSENLVIITFDWVWLPSHQTAYMTSVSEETQYSMLNYGAYADKQMALTESLNLYENGSLIDITAKENNEKGFIDYCASHSTGYMALSEMYHYNPNDTIKEINNSYVILENDNNILKVGKEDYLLKATRYQMHEMSCAPVDCRMGQKNPENPIEAEVKKEVGDKAENVNADVASSVDEPNGVKLPKGVTDNGSESNPDVESKDVVETKHTDKDVDSDKATKLTESKEGDKAIAELDKALADSKKKKPYKAPTKEQEAAAEENDAIVNGDPVSFGKEMHFETKDGKRVLVNAAGETIKEEFYKYYNIVAEEANLHSKKDIINEALKYTDYMSKECAFLFKELAKDGE